MRALGSTGAPLSVGGVPLDRRRGREAHPDLARSPAVPTFARRSDQRPDRPGLAGRAVLRGARRRCPSYGEDGTDLLDDVGELVITTPDTVDAAMF
ncbi:hypothetical protein HBB16_05070 [Pseudonocardia sp. MCCB 268]|nr:hypothetical protein [Pseudonocardia cytotoxica]